MAGLDLSKILNPTSGSIFISGLPVPPTSNHQYVSMVRGGRTIRFKSKGAKDYEREFHSWAIRNKSMVDKAIVTLEKWHSPLEARAYVIFEKSRLITKDFCMKKLDISNRMKALHDLLCDVLLIDDCHFVTNVNEKIISDNKDEQVIIILQPRKMRFESQLYDALDKEGVMNES